MQKDTIGQRIKQKRVEKGLTQTDLGDAVGVTAQAVNQWEDGKTSPRGKRIDKLAEALGTTAEWLVFGAPSKTGQPLMGFVSEPTTEYDECEALARRIERLPPEDQARVTDLIDRLLAK